jgi:hypothetical protein
MDKDILDKMLSAFDEIQMPRTPYALENLVVNCKFTTEQQYAQCVLELSIAYDNLRTAKLNTRIKEIQIKNHLVFTETQRCKRDILIVELEQLRRTILGAVREFEVLFNLWKSYPIKYTREQLNDAQKEEFRIRLETQAQFDMNASGRISASNQEGLRQIGRMTYPQLDVSREVEKRFLADGKLRCLMVIPTIKKAETGLPCIENIAFPSGAEVKILNVFDRAVDDAYNYAIQMALDEQCDFVLTIEDDTFPPADAFVSLLKLIRENSKCVVGAWYPKKEVSLQGAHIEKIDNVRGPMSADGTIKEAYTIAMGCTLYPIGIFMKIPYPWFKTTPNMTQDSFFSQLAREAGYKLLVDTSIKCRHIDAMTGKVYE